MRTVRIAGWGNYPVITARRHVARGLEDLVRCVESQAAVLPQGNGRSYGDAGLFEVVVSTLELNRLLAFDRTTGVLRAEAGVTLDEIIRFALPKGWFLPVTPGTKQATLGGCVAADVHGKNHHRDGSIGHFIDALELVLADGSVVPCSPTEKPDLFRATIGGMGLTGFVYAVDLRLRPVTSAFVDNLTIKTANLAETCAVLLQTQEDHLYSVAWIDCLSRRLGRGLVMLGDHAPRAAVEGRPFRLHREARVGLPFLPGFTLNRPVVKTLNALYYGRQWRARCQRLVHYDPYFYPLDVVSNWNRAYGRRGFLQYQFAFPFEGAEATIEDFAGSLAAAGFGSTFAVLKTFGARQAGILSFPCPGFTLALDLPVGAGRVIPLLQRLTEGVIDAGGRVYLAKDAVVTPDQFRRMYPRLDEFRRVKQMYDPQCRLRSAQSDRLEIT